MRTKACARQLVSGFFLFLLCIFSGGLQTGQAFAATDVSSSTRVTVGAPLLDAVKLQTLTPVSVLNNGAGPLTTPLQLVVESISVADVAVATPDGYTSDGKPFFAIVPFAGDMNGDGVYDSADAALFSSAFAAAQQPGKAPCTTGVPCQTDINTDGRVDAADQDLFTLFAGKNPTSLAPGAYSATRTLSFNNPKKLRFTFTTAVRSGQDARVNIGMPIWDAAKLQSLAPVSVKNFSAGPLALPVRVVIESVSPAEVTVVAPDGETATGKPFFILPPFSGDMNDDGTGNAEDIKAFAAAFAAPGLLGKAPCTSGVPCQTDVDTDGDVDGIDLALFNAHLGKTFTALASGDITATRVIRFNNPKKFRFNFTTSVLAGPLTPPNRPPVITTAELPDGQENEAYSFTVAASDPDAGDVLSFSLTGAPDGMAIDTASGRIDWLPPSKSAGNHVVAVEVKDRAGLAASKEFTLHIIPAKDLAAPQVKLILPAQAQAGSVIAMSADCTDNVAVTGASLFVDGLLLQEFTEPPYAAGYNAPDNPGQRLNVLMTAVDAAGNIGRAEGSVLVVATPDTTLPTISAIGFPQNAAPGEAITVRAEVSDDRGLAEVRFRLGDGAVKAVQSPPYETGLTVPPGSPAGGTILLTVEAVDSSGNRAEATRQIAVRAGADTTPPEAVTLSGPQQSLPGQTLAFTATAVDQGGILKVVFLADGQIVGEDTEAPFQFSYTIAADRAPGGQTNFQSRAYDFAGNSADSAPLVTRIVAPGQGIIAGEVYDDSTGLPVAGALVRLIAAQGKPVENPPATHTDSRGRYGFLAEEGTAVVAIGMANRSTVFRTIAVQPDSIAAPLDARLTPVGPAAAVNNLTGGNVSIAADRASLYVPPGAFSGSTFVFLNTLSPQGLPAVLPAGWSPVAIARVDADAISQNAALELTLRGLPASDRLIAVRYDESSRQWIRIESAASLSGDGVVLAISALGTVAMVLPDAQPAAPATPDIGQPLAGVAAQPIPAGAIARILPTPEILFMQPGAKSEVRTLIEKSPLLPSGTVVQVDFSETYERTDHTALRPEGTTQDFILYQGDSGLESRFVASPSEIFDPILLKEGLIRLDAHRPSGSDGSGLVGPAGGTVASPDGFAIVIPAGSLGKTAPVQLKRLSADPALAGASDFTWISGAELLANGASLASSATLTLPLPQGVTADDQVLLVRAVRIGNATRFELVGIATAGNGVLTIDKGGLGLPFSGVDGEGRYHALKMKQPVGFATGVVAPLHSGLAESSALPFISLVDTAQPRYVLALPLGNSTITGLDLTDGGSAQVAVDMPAKNGIIQQDLALAASRPVVASITPSDGATGVPMTAAITVRFSRPMDSASINAASFTISDGQAQVPGAVMLLADQMSAVFRPSGILAENRLHHVTLAAAICDSFGNPLFGNQADGSYVSSFTTPDITPPARPAPGQVSMGMPDANGLVRVGGTLGTVEPNTAVTVINQSTHATSTVIAGADGSFNLTISADIWHQVELVLTDQAGNKTTFSPGIFNNGNGIAAVGPTGGTVTLADGSSFTFAPGSFERAAEVTIEPIVEAALPIPTPADYGMEFAAGFTIDTDGQELLQPLKFRIPTTGSYTTNTKFLVSRIDEVMGEKRQVAVESARYEDGFIIVNSPPWPGMLGMMSISTFVVNAFFENVAVTFVTGEVHKAPPIGVLSIEVEKAMAPGFTAHVVARATPTISGVTVSDWKMEESLNIDPLPGPGWTTVTPTIESGNQVAKYDTVVDASTGQQLVSFIQYYALGQRSKTWRVEATFTTASGEKFVAKTEVSTLLVINPMFDGDPTTDKAMGTDHIYKWRGLESSGNPYMGAWVEVFNGVASGYPTVTQTNKLGRFVLAVPPGQNYIRIFDPVTGSGSKIPFDAPSTFGDFVSIPRIVVPEAVGDGIPPTLDVQVTGTLTQYGTFMGTVNATDDKELALIQVSVQGRKEAEWTASGTTYSNTFTYTPLFGGDLEIETIAVDKAGNRTTRKTAVRVKDIVPGLNTTAASGTTTLQPNSVNVDTGMEVDVKLNTPVAERLNLADMIGIGAYFMDSAGNRIDAYGGSTGNGEYLHITPASPLPPNTKLKLVLDNGAGTSSPGGACPSGATCIEFTTKGMDAGGILGGFGEIRGIAISGHYAYVADFKNNQIAIVDLADPTNPTLAGSFPFLGPRGLATENNIMVVIGNGGTASNLPVLRLYDLGDPLAPTKVGSVILFPLGDQALPINVRIKPGGALAYVSTVGIGIQSVDLNIIREIATIPYASRTDDVKMGQPAIVGGLKLPNEAAIPPFPVLTASPFDTAMLPGLVLTGGSTAQLFVLAGTVGGYLSIIPQVDDAGSYLSPYVPLQYGVQRVAAASDFLIRKDLDNDGRTDLYQNINLAVVSHGTDGLSFVDVSNPARGKVLSTLNTGSRIFDMDIVDGWVFTGDKVVTMYDPTQAVASDALKYKKPDDTEYTFSSGGDLDVDVFFSSQDGRRYSILASSDGPRTTLQVALMENPPPGPDWDIIRTTAFEPWVNPDNADYFHTGDPVNPFTGEFTQEETDMTVPGRGLHFSFSRTYRSQNEFKGPLGYGWDFNYNTRLTVLPDASDPTKSGDVLWYDGAGKTARFVKVPATATAPASYTPPDGVFAELKDGSDTLSTFFELTDSAGVKMTFRPMNQQGQVHYALFSMEDRLKNIMRFKYNYRGQLEKVRDTLGRDYQLSYDLQGRLVSLTDFSGRQIVYRYDYADNLVYVTTPPVTGFTNGKTTQYVYDSSHPTFDVTGVPLPERLLNHNLLRIIDPDGNTYLENEYGMASGGSDFDRVRVQHFGKPGDDGAGDYQFAYTVTGNLVTSATTTNRRGDKTIRNYDSAGHLKDVTEDAEVNGGRTQVKTQYEYFQPSGLLKKVTTPSGMKTEYTYDSANAKVIRQADMLTSKVTSAGGGAARTTTIVPGDWGTPTSITDPEGRVTTFTLDTNGNGLIEKITSPSITQSDGSSQTIMKTFSYGTFGEVLATTDATGVVTQYDYFSARDPNGDNDDSETADARNDNELELNGKGLLKSVTQDSSQGGSGTPRRAVSGSALNLKSTFAYDEVGNITKVTDPRGLVTTHTVNELNQTTAVVDGRGTKKYTFDGNDNLKEVEEFGGRKVVLAYNSLNLLTETTESYPNGQYGGTSRKTRYKYDKNENLTRVTSALDYDTITSYDPRGLATEVSTGGSGQNAVSGVLQKARYDADGLLTREEDADGHATTHTWDGFHQRESRKDANGNEVRFEYDDNGHLVAARNYDSQGTLVSESKWELDQVGRTRVFRQTIVGGLGSGTSNPTEETRYVYDAEGRVLTVTDPMGRNTTMTYDGLGRLLTQTDKLGNKKTLVYTGLDLTKMTMTSVEPGGTTSSRSTDYTYDVYGRLTEEKIGAGTTLERKRTITYDANDLPTKEVIAGGITTDRTYDGYLRLTTITTGRESTEITYDDDNRVTAQSDAQGRAMSSTYDGRSRLVRLQFPDSTAKTFSYYPDNLLKQVTDRAGNTIRYTYDNGNRIKDMTVTAVAGFEGITGQTYIYDALNQVVKTAVTSPTGSNSISYTYNSRGEALTETQGAHTIHRSFDLGGSLISAQYPSGTLSFGRDPLGRLASVSAGGTTLAQYSYSGANRLKKATYANGVSATIGYNAVYELVSKTYASGANTLTGFDLAYDQAGRIQNITKANAQGGQSETLGYTAEGWLASVQGQNSSVSYDYDASGNRASVDHNGAAESYTTNDLNQYLMAGAVAFVYDANGNVHADDRFRFTFDVFGRLVRVEEATGGATIATYEYDAAGRRIGRTEASGSETLAYDGTQLVSVSDATGTVLRKYLYGAGGRVPFAMLRGADTFYLQYDVNGSIAAITDASGQIVERYAFDADGIPTIFDAAGAVRATSAVDFDFGFAGALIDPATGLMHMGARDYAPALGRFLQPDPAGTMDGMNLYAYAGNDPVNFIDPTGLFRQASADNINIRSFSGVSLLQGGQFTEMMVYAPDMVRGLGSLGKAAMRGAPAAGRAALNGAKFAVSATPRAARIFKDIAKEIISSPVKGSLRVAKRVEIMMKQQGANWIVAGQELNGARAMVRREVELGFKGSDKYHTGGKFGLGEGKDISNLSGTKKLQIRVNRLIDNTLDSLTGESRFEKPFVQGKITAEHGYERVLRKDIDVITDAEWAKPNNPHAEPFRYEIAHAGNQGSGMRLFDDVYSDHGVMPPTFKNAQGVGKDLESLDLYSEGNWIHKPLKSSRPDGMVWVDPREIIHIPASIF